MTRRSICAFASLAALALVGCHDDLPPPNVPGPTTAHADGGTGAIATGPAPTEAAPTGRVALRNADSRVVSFRIAFAGGSSDDPRGKEGLTELTAVTMAEGGTKALTYAELVAKLYPLAASIRVNVDRDETVFSAEVASASLDAFYPLLRDVILAPRLDDDGFTRLRARQTSTLTSDLRGADDELLSKEALQALIYEGHPYGHPERGTEHGLTSLTLDDLGAQRKHVFCKERLLLGLAGGFPQGFDDAVARDLAQLPTCDSQRASLPAPAEKHGAHVLIVDKPSSDSTAIAIGFPTPITRASAEYPSLIFATDYLGLHRQSAGRLFSELREKRGLNYGDYAYAEFFAQEGAGRYPLTNITRRQQMVTIWIRPVRKQNALFALRAALYVYGKLVDGGVSKDEIARYRSFVSRYEGLAQQTESRRLGYAMDDVSYGLKTPYLETVRKAWDGLDETTLAALIKAQLTTKDLQIAIVGKDGEALAAALLKGDPSPPTYDGPKPADVKSDDREIEKFALPLKPEDVKVVPVADMFK